MSTRLIPGEGRSTYPREGYAILRCGAVEVQISATLMHHLTSAIPALMRGGGNHPCWAAMADTADAIRKVAAEALKGEIGEADRNDHVVYVYGMGKVLESEVPEGWSPDNWHEYAKEDA